MHVQNSGTNWLDDKVMETVSFQFWKVYHSKIWHLQFAIKFAFKLIARVCMDSFLRNSRQDAANTVHETS